jgi:EAL domain-containing protein (putative c-di-GMP-specific phosphodiesterase class I)
MDMRLPPGVAQLATTASAPQALPAFSYAFQPIVDSVTRQAHAYEALIRGPEGEAAGQVLQAVPEARRLDFDQFSRAAAIGFAARCGYAGRLNLNFLAQATATAARSLRHTAQAATRHGIALERITLEFTDGDALEDPAGFAALLNEYRGLGMMAAIDDFAGGERGLELLERYQPDSVKIDMWLLRGIERHAPHQATVQAILRACRELGVEVVAEGVETAAEYEWLARLGLRYFQGHLFARPGFESFPAARVPEAA